jgi:hypothetical protein
MTTGSIGAGASMCQENGDSDRYSRGRSLALRSHSWWHFMARLRHFAAALSRSAATPDGISWRGCGISRPLLAAFGGPKKAALFGRL